MQFLTKSPHAIDDLLRLFFNPPNFSAHFTRNILAHEVKTPVKDFNKSIDNPFQNFLDLTNIVNYKAQNGKMK